METEQLTEREKTLYDLLDIIILNMMLVEKLENFQLHSFYNTYGIKNSVQKLLKQIIPIAERDYTTVFNNGETETLQIISEYEKMIIQIRDKTVPEKVILTQMIEAYNFDRKTIEATCHRILKKYDTKTS